MRVLELRGFEAEENPTVSVIEKESPLDSLPENQALENSPNPKIPYSSGEMQEKLRDRITVSSEMLKKAKQQCKTKTEQKGKRTRKERQSWAWVIKKLVEEGLLLKEITPQALKKRLKISYPEWPWEKI
jgi:hypothetical protein